MKRTKVNQWLKVSMFALAAAFLFLTSSITSSAESAATVVAKSANIRQEASASSTALASVVANNTLSVIGKVTGADGKVWYQVFVDANTKGYIRSDLVKVADEASVPSLDGTTTTTAPGNTTTTDPQSATVDPTGAIEVAPISGKVSGATTVNVRAKASASAGWVASASRNTPVTVTGYITAADGKNWYLLTYTEGGKQITGFIREDYVTLDGALVQQQEVPVEEQPVEENPGVEEPVINPEPSAPVIEDAPYDVGIVNEMWYLFDYNQGKQYAIEEFISAADINKKLYEDSQETVSGQKIVIIILVILLIGLAAVIGFMVYRNMSSDGDEYPPKRDREPARRPAPGADRRPARRPAEDGKPRQQRPAQQQAKRPGQPGTRPAGNPTSHATKTHDIRVNEPNQMAKPEIEKEKPVVNETPKQPVKQERKPKNFLQDDDEFEFEFLNWSGEEEE